MNSLERVTLTLQHKEADRIPVYPLINSIARNTIGATYAEIAQDPEKCAEAYIKITEELGLDVICTLTDLSVEAGCFGQKLVFHDDKAAHPALNDYLIKDPKEFKNIKHINPRETGRMKNHIKVCKTLVEKKGKDTPIVAFVFAPLGIISMLRGQANLFFDLIDNPDSVHEGLKIITDVMIEYCDALIETGVHAIMFDTLFGSRSILSKQMWDDFEGPYVEKLAKHIHDKGVMVMIHNCGNGVYFDAQIKRMHPEAISFLHIPDDCADFAECKAKYGDVTTLIGCIDPGWLVTASENDVEEEAKKEIDIFKKNGGFILSTGCEYPSNKDTKNAEAIVRTAKTYGKY